MSVFNFPDVGEGITEGTLLKWLVKVGDQVKAEQVIAEVETDKAVVEIPSPQDGTIGQLHGNEGDVLKVGEVLVTFGEGGGQAPPKEEPKEEQKPAEQAERSEAKEPAQSAEAPKKTGPGVVGDIPEYDGPEPESSKPNIPEHHYFQLKNGDAIKTIDELEQKLVEIDDETFSHHANEYKNDFATWIRDVFKDEDMAFMIEGAKTKEAIKVILEQNKSASAQSQSTQKPGGPVKAMPAVRKEAKEKGIDLSTVTPSGKSGQITKEDLQQTSPASKSSGSDHGPVETVPTSTIRKTIAKHMSESATITATVTHIDEADVTNLFNIKEKYKAAYKEEGLHLSLLAFIVRYLVNALKKHPYFNAEYDEKEITLKKYYNIGIAVDTEKGLIVPNIKDADTKSVKELSQSIMQIAQKAKDGSVTIPEMRGGTFTITNVGSIGGLYATPIINYPEVAILALGKMVEKPVVKNGEIVIRKIMPLSLTFDHRIVDGGNAARFVTDIISYIEDPAKELVE